MAGRRRKTDEQNEFNAALGLRLESLRKAAGVTPKELARQVGVTTQQLYWYETGASSIPVYRLPLFAFALGVELATLVQESSNSVLSK